jgi:hypothetical protein
VVGGLDAGKYFWRSGREKCFSLDIPFYRTSGLSVIRPLRTAAARAEAFLFAKREENRVWIQSCFETLQHSGKVEPFEFVLP